MPIIEEEIDGLSGLLFPFYDSDTHMLYLAGKVRHVIPRPLDLSFQLSHEVMCMNCIFLRFNVNFSLEFKWDLISLFELTDLKWNSYVGCACPHLLIIVKMHFVWCVCVKYLYVRVCMCVKECVTMGTSTLLLSAVRS